MHSKHQFEIEWIIFAFLFSNEKWKCCCRENDFYSWILFEQFYSKIGIRYRQHWLVNLLLMTGIFQKRENVRWKWTQKLETKGPIIWVHAKIHTENCHLLSKFMWKDQQLHSGKKPKIFYYLLPSYRLLYNFQFFSSKNHNFPSKSAKIRLHFVVSP